MLDDSFRIKNLDKIITEKKKINENPNGIVESAKLNCQQIAIKSCTRKNEHLKKDEIVLFNNEIINHQIINDKLEKCTNEEEN